MPRLTDADAAAINWLATLTAGGVDATLLAQFEGWLDADEGHLPAFDAACALWTTLGQPCVWEPGSASQSDD